MSVSNHSLILIKHAMPNIVEGKPPSSWLLSSDGRKSCLKLAERLRELQPGIVVTSTEPKANETGLLTAEALGIPLEIAEGLHEHRRESAPFLDDPSAWHSLVEEFFARPGELVLGEETATEARNRFTTAIQAVLDRYPDQTLAVVCHGTVISLYAAHVTGTDPFPLWKRLGLPSFVVMSRTRYEILEVVENVS